MMMTMVILPTMMEGARRWQIRIEIVMEVDFARNGPLALEGNRKALVLRNEYKRRNA